MGGLSWPRPERVRYMDYVWVGESNWGMLAPGPVLVEKTLGTLVQTFDIYTWASVLGTLIVLRLLAELIRKLALSNEAFAGKSIFELCQILLQQGTTEEPTMLSTRFLEQMWWFLSFLLAIAYTTILVAQQAVPLMTTPMNTFDELLESGIPLLYIDRGPGYMPPYVA